MSETTPQDLRPSRGGPPAPFPLILCGVNGSRYSRLAAEQALELAGSDGAVHFLAVTDVVGVGPNRMARVGPWRAAQAIDHAKRLARKRGAVATTELRRDTDPRRALLTEAAGYDLLVIGSHARTRAEGVITGSTAALALHESDVPVLIARPPIDGKPMAGRIVVASDGTAGDRPAIDVAATIAARSGGSVILLHVQDSEPPEVRRELADQATDLFLATGTEPVILTPRGRIEEVIAITADLHATLLVLGSHRRHGARALVSVSERVGARARCSVLVLRSGTPPPLRRHAWSER